MIHISTYSVHTFCLPETWPGQLWAVELHIVQLHSFKVLPRLECFYSKTEVLQFNGCQLPLHKGRMWINMLYTYRIF